MTRKKKISEILVENRGVAGKFLWVMANVLFSKQNVNLFNNKKCFSLHKWSRQAGKQQKGLDVIYAYHERVHSCRCSPHLGWQIQWLASGESRCNAHHRIRMTTETETKVTVGTGGGRRSWKDVRPGGHVRRARQRRWRKIGPRKCWHAVMDGLCTWLSRHRRDGCPICNNTLNLLFFTTWPVTVAFTYREKGYSGCWLKTWKKKTTHQALPPHCWKTQARNG